MTVNSTVIVEGQPDDHHRALLVGMAASAAALVLLTTALLFTGRWILAVAPLIGVAGLLVMSYPRLALYQYVFVLFIQWELVESLPLWATDVSAALLIAAALLDILLSARLPSRLPRLTLNFAALLLAVFVAAALGSDPATSLRSLLRLSFLLLTFLAVYRLAGRIEVDLLVRLFFWLCVLHAVVVLGGFVASGGTQRSWGFSPSVFNGLAMMTLPVGMCLYLWDRSGKVGLYLIGSVLVMGALISTQSRFSIFLGVTLTALVMVLSWHRYRRILKGKVIGPANSMATTPLPQVNRRLLVVAATTLGASIALLAAQPFILQSVVDRFARLISSPVGETVYLRLMLWSFAVKAFLANPLTGIGPGCFRYVQEIIPTLRLTQASLWVRGLTAHNLFLHYLAETGLIGATALVALFVNQYRYGRRIWKSGDERTNNACSLALYIISTLFLVTTFLEAGWFWGQTAYAFVFFAALIVRQFQRQQSALMSNGPR